MSSELAKTFSEQTKSFRALEAAVREIGARLEAEDGPALTPKQATTQIGKPAGYLYRPMPDGRKRWEHFGGFKPDGGSEIRIPRAAIRRFNEGGGGGS